MTARSRGERSHPPATAPDVDVDDGDPDSDGLGPPPATESTVHVAELRLWKLERGQIEGRALQREAIEILRLIQGYLGQLTELERAREARVSLARLALEILRGVLERLAAPEALTHLAVIARWVGVTVVALAAIVYGVGVSGYGVTIGTGGSIGITGPADPPAPNPGQPVPTP